MSEVIRRRVSADLPLIFWEATYYGVYIGKVLKYAPNLLARVSAVFQRARAAVT